MVFHAFRYREADAVVRDDVEYDIRPVVDVRLDAGGVPWTMQALIDTGATNCLFPLGAAEVLGLDMTPAAGREFGRFRIVGQVLKAYPHHVTLTLPPFEELNWQAEVWFFTEEWPLPFALLGNDGFLDRWVVSFNRASNYFIVESPPEFDNRLPAEVAVDLRGRRDPYNPSWD